MHLIIVEDLAADCEKLAELIREDCAGHEENVDFSFYSSGEDFLSHYRPKCCDGLFLDIVLGGLTGMAAAQKVREQEPLLPVIFTTTVRDYAVDGFAVRATDYLIKPLTPEQVARCMGRLREYLAPPSTISLQEPSARGHSRLVEIILDDILYGQYLDHVMTVYTVSGVYRTRSSFQDFTAQLPHTGRFHICGRGLVVNMAQVSRVLDTELLLKNGNRLSFSRNRRQEVQKAYADCAADRTRKGGWAK